MTRCNYNVMCDVIDDILLHKAVLLSASDEFCDLAVSAAKPLGIMLEKSGSWGIVKEVKQSDLPQSLVGAAIDSIDGRSVILSSFEETAQMLRSRRQRSVVRLRCPLTKKGMLRKLPTKKSLAPMTSSSSSSTMMTSFGGLSIFHGSGWKERYFEIARGGIAYWDSAPHFSSSSLSSYSGAHDQPPRGAVGLMGGVVSLLDDDVLDAPHCFQLRTGSTCLYLQAANETERLQWAAALYHATGVANGGNHIIGLEKQIVDEVGQSVRELAETVSRRVHAEQQLFQVSVECDQFSQHSECSSSSLATLQSAIERLRRLMVTAAEAGACHDVLRRASAVLQCLESYYEDDAKALQLMEALRAQQVDDAKAQLTLTAAAEAAQRLIDSRGDRYRHLRDAMDACLRQIAKYQTSRAGTNINIATAEQALSLASPLPLPSPSTSSHDEIALKTKSGNTAAKSTATSMDYEPTVQQVRQNNDMI